MVAASAFSNDLREENWRRGKGPSARLSPQRSRVHLQVSEARQTSGALQSMWHVGSSRTFHERGLPSSGIQMLSEAAEPR